MWRWRWEITVTITTLVVLHHLITDTGWSPIASVLAMATPVGVALTIGPTRRFLRNRFWCVITRHRVRACLTEMRTLNYSGNLPFIIGCFSTKTGESVWLWMRPGLSHTDLENRSETISSACWARHAVISRSARNAALIRIDIERRDPLSKAVLTSPLLEETSDLPDGEIAKDAVLDFIGSVNPTTEQQPAPLVQDEPPARGDTRKTKKTTAAIPDGGSVILVNGEDVSDYV
ncbi:hypothetical protein [Kribbella sancticallisti]|uniref:hypothetical protein n=1 Tax=Kribbella sancticallisti TaxID=460087 RepID=UPI0031E37236